MSTVTNVPIKNVYHSVAVKKAAELDISTPYFINSILAKELGLDKRIGEVSHYFGKASVVAFKVYATLSVGDKIRFVGNTTDFEQVVESMQIEKEDVEKVESGSDIGIKVSEKVRVGDVVYLV